jgi:tRNA threonylcarbamoyladenosine biosynthesis protein TsaE
MRIVTRSEEETLKIGARIGEKLKAGDVISLNGELGAGKTHITKGIAKGLGVEDYITSPTFIIVNEYEGRIPLYHFDVYRINDIDEMYEIGFDEYLYGNGVCIVEWGKIVEELLPEYVIKIDIIKIDDNTREIIISENGKLALLEGVVI